MHLIPNIFKNEACVPKVMRYNLCLTLLLLLSSTLAGCTSDETSEEKLESFPQFSTTGDNGEVYDNQRMAGEAFIVMFSAEWCNNPCYTTMFAIWETIPELPILVMSTDPAENASGLSLQDWHESANAHDDDGEDPKVTLTTYVFMKGSDVAEELGIKSPGSLAFVTPNGEISEIHVGRLDDASDIQAKWDAANSS